MSHKIHKNFFYQAEVIDNKDPLMLGRVRAKVLVDNFNDIVNSFTNPPFDETKDKWTSRDPFLFTTFLPYFVYQIPKEKELIFVFYYNNDYKFQNQFYIQASFSSPTASPGEFIVGAQSETGLGGQYKSAVELKNQDGTYADKSAHEGVFPEPGDNAILGRGSADLIVKEDEVLLRAGKTVGDIQPNVKPTANNTRSFLQLSKFNRIKIFDKDVTYVENFEQTVMVNYLIEWVINNPENLQQKFTGTVYLYRLKPNIRCNSKELKVDSNVDDLKFLVSSSDFQSLSSTETANFINNFISICNKKGTINGKKVFLNEPYPIFYRPNNQTYNKMVSTPSSINGLEIPSNINSVYIKVKLNNSTLTPGYGLIWREDNVGKPYSTKTTQVPLDQYNSSPVTFAALGGDKICLLSHESSIPGKGKINFDGTLYGISNDVYTDEIIPKTSSMVRGEELLELINLIVRFLTTHTHAYPGLPPVPVTQDGSNTDDLLSQMQNAVNKVLNQYIRLN